MNIRTFIDGVLPSYARATLFDVVINDVQDTRYLVNGISFDLVAQTITLRAIETVDGTINSALGVTPGKAKVEITKYASTGEAGVPWVYQGTVTKAKSDLNWDPEKATPFQEWDIVIYFG